MWSFGKKGGSDHKTPSQAKTSDGNAALASSDPRAAFKNKKLSSSSRELGKTAKSKSPMGLPRTPQQELRKRRVIPGGSGHRRRSTANAGDDYLEDMSVNETSNGIEVSFPGSRSKTKGKAGKIAGQSPVISLKEQILQRQRVFQSQFSTKLTGSNDESFLVNAKKWKPKGHRIPLLGITSSPPNYAEALQLLKTTPLIDERTAVQKELNFMEAEISSLERDRIWLEQSLQGLNTMKANPGSDDAGMDKENAIWDAHTLLKKDATKTQPLPISERTALQKQRGNYLTIHLSNERIQERFILAFGGQRKLRRTTIFRNDDSIVTLAPYSDSSTDTGATVLQHIALTSSEDKANGLHFSPDFGKSQSVGQMSSKLCQRLEDNEKDIADVSYLSTGSRGCYFAKFQSGECWWGSAVEDADFQNILNAWDVYRVEFGPMKTIENSKFSSTEKPEKKRNPQIQSEATLVNSWIILSSDGKAAWKNLPSRLASKLETRSAAPVEISLGIGDSYFVRFLDGSIDYSLPSKIARVCERIEERGGKITNVSLHPDISHEFIVRHTELTR